MREKGKAARYGIERLEPRRLLSGQGDPLNPFADFNYVITANGTQDITTYPDQSFDWTVTGSATETWQGSPDRNFNWSVLGSGTETWTTTEQQFTKVTVDVDFAPSGFAQDTALFVVPYTGVGTYRYSIYAAGGTFLYHGAAAIEIKRNGTLILDRRVVTPPDGNEFIGVAPFSFVAGDVYEIRAWIGQDISTSAHAHLEMSYPSSVGQVTHTATRTATDSGAGVVRQTDGNKFISNFSAIPQPQQGGTISGISYTVSDDDPEVNTSIVGNGVYANTAYTGTQTATRTATDTDSGTINATQGIIDLGPFSAPPQAQAGGTLGPVTYSITDNNPNVDTWIAGGHVFASTSYSVTQTLPWSATTDGSGSVRLSDDDKLFTTSTLVAPNHDTTWTITDDSDEVETWMVGASAYARLTGYVQWDGGGNGTSWHDALNWEGDLLPGPQDKAIINILANPAIQITSTSGNVVVKNLATAERLQLSSGSIAVAQNIDLVGADLELAGGTIHGGIVAGSGGGKLVLTNQGGMLDGVTLNCDLDATVQVSNAVVINGLMLNGTATIGGGSLGSFSYSHLDFAGSQVLGGTGTVVFGDGFREGLVVTQDNSVLTIGAGITIRGGNAAGDTNLGAVIGSGGYFGGDANTSIINRGTIWADTSDRFLVVSSSGNGTFTNQGLIRGSNGGTVILRGTITDLGMFDSNSGTVALAGTLENTGKTVSMSSATGPLTLYGGTIRGGIVSGSGGGKLVLTNQSGTLDGVTLNCDLEAISGNGSAIVINGLTLNGTATIGGSSLGSFSHSHLAFLGSQVLGGTGTVMFGNEYRQGLVLPQDNSTLTIGPGITIRGGSAAVDANFGTVIGSGSYFIGGANTSIINQGTIWADAPNRFLIISSSGNGNFINQGLIRGSNGGTVILRGTITDLGMFDSNSGTVALAGTLENTGKTVSMSSATGPLTLYGGTIRGGIVSGSGGGKLVLTNQGGTLDGVTLNCDLDATAQVSNAAVINGLTLNGTATIGGSSLGSFSHSHLAFLGSQVLGGTGTVMFGNEYRQGLVLPQDNSTLTIGPGITIRGGSAAVDANLGTVIGSGSYFIGGANTSIINQGTIWADSANKFLIIGPNGGSFTNEGALITSAGAFLNVNGDLTFSSGTQLVFHSYLGDESSHGRLNVTGTATLNGPLRVGYSGAFSPAPGTTFDVLTAGTISGTFSTVQIDSGTHAPLVVSYLTGAVRLTAQPDTFAPAKVSDQFSFATFQQIAVSFSEAVSGLTASNIQLVNLTTGQTIPNTQLQLTMSADGGAASIRYLGASGGMMPDGFYRLTLPAGSFGDTRGNLTTTAISADFFVLAADANHDRKVDIRDLTSFMANFMKPDVKTFAQGDFNYDGTVDRADLSILARNWQKTLPLPAPPLPPPAQASALPKRPPTRTVDLIR